MKGLILILVAIQLLVPLEGAICTVTQNGTTACSAGCSVCNNGVCQSCCLGYYLQGNVCNTCTDAHCQSCNHNGATEVCNYCVAGYGVTVLNTATCSVCDSTTERNCQSINNCTSNSNCAFCNRYSLNSVSQCVLCSANYRNCTFCNNTHCLGCITGYAINVSSGYKQCVSCNLPMCYNCTAGPVCAYCLAGYYVFNNTCFPCPMPCTTCTSATVCTACDSSTLLYSLFNSTCAPCNDTLIGCYTCTNSATFICNSCLDGYYFASPTCTPCVSPCIICTSAAVCTKCINASYAISSNRCALCSSQVTNCELCNAGFICTSCSDGYYLSGNTCQPCNSTFSECISCDSTKCFACGSGSQIQSDFTCSSSDCTSQCLTCIGSKTTCKSCISGYYLSGSSCLACDVSCGLCANASYCLTCAPDLQFNAGVCTACVAGQNFNPFSLLCEACPSHCSACEWWAGCSACDDYFELTAKTGVNRCTDICGDLYAADLPCDSTIGVANDGCTDECAVQADFACTKTAFASQCSYTGSVEVSIVSAVQSPFANNLQLGFRVHPYLLGLPTNADAQSYIQSIFELSPLNTLASLTVSVDERTETVTFSIDHAADISAADFTFTVNLAYLAGVDPMFQHLANVSLSQNTAKILRNGRLGEYQEADSLKMAQTLYAWSEAVGVCALCIMLFGTLGKELAGLDQAVLCQHIFLLLLFFEGRLGLPLLALGGLRYSTGLHLSEGSMALSQTQAYNLQLDASGFLLNCNFNLAAYVLPLALSFAILLYKLRYKHLPARRDLAQQTYEVLMGETVLYFAVFNLSGLVAFAFLFYAHSSRRGSFYDSLAVFTAALFALFALFNFFAKPEIVGMFRSAFRTESEERDARPRQKWLRSYAACISKRCCEERLGGAYAALTLNFYLVYLLYLAGFLLALLLLPAMHLPVVLVLQVLMLLLVVFVRPHFNVLEKARALLTWSSAVAGTLTVLARPQGFALPAVLLALLTLHVVVSLLAIVASLWQQLKRKCNDRSEVVKGLMKEGQPDLEKDALKELILRFQNIERQNYSIDREVQKIQHGYEDASARTRQRDQEEEEGEEEEGEKERERGKGEGRAREEEAGRGGLLDEELAQFEEEIIVEEHEHFRYQKGLDFFDKYNGDIDNALIRTEYPRIQ